jgi:1-acyl-sn-glycerol-3-phosphate acyltransferase
MESAQAVETLIERVRAWARERVDPEIEARLARVPMVRNEFGYDPFGFDPETFKYAAIPARWIYKNYFRVEAHGVERVPEGRVLLVSNHAGQIPVDGAMVAISLFLEAEPPRIARSMVEKWVPTLPFVSVFFSRCGQVVGTPENCRWLLEHDQAILVFPEGVKGVSKTFDKRYRLQEFGLGFMRLALESRAPIVPVAVIGSEEQAPALYNFTRLAKVIGTPSFPVTPTFPFLLPVGALPYPVKYRIYFGEPMRFEGDPSDEDAVIGQQVKRVKYTLQEMIDGALKRRQHVFW